MIRLSITLIVVIITLAFTAGAAWACPACNCEAKPKASAPAADREAILAMAGEYHVKFQFQETVGMLPGYELTKPYHTEATEFVEVIEDTGDFISLQHVLVLHDPEAPDAEARVVKHWRQDWTYQDTQILAFRGHRTWETQELTAEQAAGTWSQAVFQVDDSPRYESFGKWTHVGDRSAWESAETWRPLPRREYTKRSDYHVMVARNRHTITPGGWVHEQDNHKLVLDEQGQPVTVIAHESGLNVYDHTNNVDFTAGRLYWQQTAAYWQDVRSIWADTFAQHPTISLQAKVDGQRLHAALFGLAREVQAEGHTADTRRAASETVHAFLADAD